MNTLPHSVGWAGSIASKVMGVVAKFSGKKTRVSPSTTEARRFEAEVKDQFLKLKEKGLSIPIFTL